MKPWLAALGALASAFCAAQLQAATVYISPQGADTNTGVSRSGDAPGTGPVASVARALQLLRTARGERAAPEADEIILLPGHYRLNETLTLRPEDSGSKDAPLTIRADEPGSVVLTGSRLLTGFTQAEGASHVVAQVSLDRGFHVLWVNGKRATRARSPNGGGYFIGAGNVVPPIPGDRMLRPRNPYNVINTQKVILPEAAREILSKARAPEEHAVLVALHSWTSSAHRIVHWDAERGAVTVKPDSLWSFLRFGPDQRFAIENLPELMDEAGEWWLSPKGELRYLPRAGEAPGQITAEAPQLERLIALQGTERQPVEHVRIEGLRFAHSAAWTAPFIDSQAAMAAPSALVAEHVRHVQITGCRFEHLGGHAIWLRKGSQASMLRHNVFSGLGGGAIRVGEPAMPASEADRVNGNTITDNLIEDTGLSFPGAVGIWIGQSGSNLIAHNELRRTSYTGISLGWTWGFGGSLARENVVEYNLLQQIGQGLLSDLGGVYTLGISPGTVIRNNVIEDVRSFRQQGSTAWGVYLDEGSGGIVVENNWVDGSTGGGLHLHYGNGNLVRNNVFRGGQVAQVRRSRRGDSAITLERNVLWADAQATWEREWFDDDVLTKNNIVVTNGSAPRISTGRTLQALQDNGKETGTVWLRTRDARCSREDGCTLKPATIKATGFQPFSLKAAGIRDRGRLLR